MGIYDRTYYRDERPAWLSGRSMVVNLILINVVAFVAQSLFGIELSETFSLGSQLFHEPWNAWQLVTYGFIHADIGHILFNMIGLWFFGSEMEELYGRAEFLRVYLAMIVVAGLAWVGYASVEQLGGSLEGASGGVVGLVILYVLHFPKRTILIWGVLPVPAWALGVAYVVWDIAGMGQNGNVAHVAHLAGAAFGFVYYQAGWNLGRIVPRRFSRSMFRWRPRLRIHDPREQSASLNDEVDRILEKISRQGESSLTKKERRTLEEASRRYQQRRQ